MKKEEIPLETTQSDQDGDFSESGDIVGDGGIIKEIITHGVEGWQKPENGDDVQMHYRGTLPDGSLFDSSYDRNTPFSFKIGDGQVIKGWDIVAKTMAKGEKARVTLKPEYAYGASGSPPKIPKNATLIFDMELLSWMSKRDVFGDGSVIKNEIEAGDGWERPGSLAEVTLEVIASSLEADGKTVIAELFSGEKVFMMNSNQVPSAWETVVPDMKKEGSLHLVCKPPNLAGPGIDFVPDGTQCVSYRLTLKSWRKIEDVHSDGTLVKKILKEGDGWERPTEGSDVTINATFRLPTVDSNLIVPETLDEPVLIMEDFAFKLGDGVTVDGIDRVVQTMKTKESAIVSIAAVHAFEGAPNLLTEDLVAKGVKTSSKIVIEITLIKFDKGKDVWSMSFEEKIEEMKVRKSIGNSLFANKRYATAKKSYDRAIAFFDTPTAELSPELKAQVNELLVGCHLNLAICSDRMGDIPKCMTHCKKALEISPSNVKALYHQGCAYLKMEDFYNASSSLKYALQLSPGNPDLLRKLKELKIQRLKQDAADKLLYSNMFGGISEPEKKENSPVKDSNKSSTKVEEGKGNVSDVEVKDVTGEEN